MVWCRPISAHSDIETVNLDGNREMQKAFESSDTPDNARFQFGAFLQGWEEDDGTKVPTFHPEEKYDIVHESMTFQFIDGERETKIREVKENYLKPGGVFLTEEKFRFPKSIYLANEALKDQNHKTKYYRPEQITKKAEEVLVGMESGQADYKEYVNLLRKHFKHVEEYWKAGNFRGLVASDDRDMVEKFLKNLETIEEGARDYTFEPIGGHDE